MRTDLHGRRDGAQRPDPLPRADARPLRLEIDHRPVSVPEGTSVLRAAELAGVYVPSLCSHKELSPFGGCRLCTVEIAGMRGYPLACSTMAGEGMQVTTDTVALREMRAEVLQLILSEHPFSCLVCDERRECARSQATIRKAGVSTGCRNCPRDGECELQAVAERIGVTDVGYPIRYRGLDVEHDDPFFDRDYNLCILCGRCVRMCAEVRGTSVLSFEHRGPATVIGTAFGRTHVAAGCEFCGSCVSVCPTGALADKVSKWDGKPDGRATSTCPFCGLGCQVELAWKDGSLSAVRGAHDPEINDGQLCVRGRFCLPEATHHPDRARKPMLRKGQYFRVATWDDALDDVGRVLAQVAPEDILMVVSADLSNEGLFAARRLARSALGSAGIDSTARATLPGGPRLWRRLLSLPISVRSVAEADTVIVAGLDTRFEFSVAGVQVRRALRSGARLVVVDARESNMARMADEWVQTRPAEEAPALDRLIRRLLGDAAERLAPRSGTLAVVIGPRVFGADGAEDLVGDLERLSADAGVTVLPLAHGANLRGGVRARDPWRDAAGPAPAARPVPRRRSALLQSPRL
jgi:predicted molibdopterin-dependent oxidoreductase YjgC